MEFLTNTKIELFNPSTNETYLVKSFDSLNISESLDDPVKTFSFTAKLLSDELAHKFTVGSEVKIYHGKKGTTPSHIFTGVIKDEPKSLDGKLRKFQFSGTDFLGKLQDLIINKSYEQKNIKDIVIDLYNAKAKKYISLGTIQETEYLLDIKFKDLHLYECMEKLAEILDFIFYVDKDKRLHFHERYLKKNSQTIKKNMFHKGSANFSKDMSRLVNSLDVYGGKALSQDFSEYIKIDGLNDVYSTRYKPRTATSGKIELYQISEIDKERLRALSIGASGLADESNYDAIINYNEKTITFTDKFPTWGKAFELVYRYEVPLRTRVNQNASISKYGEFEDMISFSTINDRSTLRQRAKLHLDKYSEPLIVGSLNPHYNDYEIGEIVKVEIPELEVGHELQITQKTVNFSPNIADVSLSFEQKVPLSRVIKNILERIKELENQETEIVEQYETFEDVMEFEDIIEFKMHVKTGFIIGVSKLGDVM